MCLSCATVSAYLGCASNDQTLPSLARFRCVLAAVCVVRACAVLSAARVKYLSRSLACFLSLSLSSNSPSLLTLPLARFVFSLSLSLLSLSLLSLSLSLSSRSFSNFLVAICVRTGGDARP